MNAHYCSIVSINNGVDITVWFLPLGWAHSGPLEGNRFSILFVIDTTKKVWRKLPTYPHYIRNSILREKRPRFLRYFELLASIQNGGFPLISTVLEFDHTASENMEMLTNRIYMIGQGHEIAKLKQK